MICAKTETDRIRAFLANDGTLVDCELPDTTDALLDGIAQIGITVDFLVITHADRDHVGGSDAVVQKLSSKTYVAVEAELDTELDPDHRFQDADEIGPFEAVRLPGHSDRQHRLVDEERGVANHADALSRADQRGQPSGYFHLPPGIYSGDQNEAATSLERLLEYDFDAGLVPIGSC